MTFSDILIGAEHQFPPLYNGKCNPYILEVLSILNEVMHENGLAEYIAQNRFSLFFFLFFFCHFFGPLSRHMEVPRLGVESEM